MDKIDFFTGEHGNLALTHIIIVEEIGSGQKKFGHFESEIDVINQIAQVTNDKHYRIHKIMLMNEEGEAKELKVNMSCGKLRLTLKEEDEKDGIHNQA